MGKNIEQLYRDAIRAVNSIDDFTNSPTKRSYSGRDVTRMTSSLAETGKAFMDELGSSNISDKDFVKYYDLYKAELSPAYDRLGHKDNNQYSQALEKNFNKFRLDSSHEPNTTISPDIKTQDQLFSELLKNNPGVAVGESHYNNASREMLIREIPNFVNSGVKTMYVEMPKDQQEMIERARKNHDYSELAANMNGKRGVNSDLTVDMIKAAHEHGIDVVAIDKNQLDKDKASSIFHESNKGGRESLRVNDANYEWVDNIGAHQKDHPGKFIVWGGEAHFRKRDTSNGMVDDALGIPVVTTRQTILKEKQGFQEADWKEKATDIDFTVGGGLFGAGRMDNAKGVLEEAAKVGASLQQKGGHVKDDGTQVEDHKQDPNKHARDKDHKPPQIDRSSGK